MLAMKCAKWLQTAISPTRLTYLIRLARSFRSFIIKNAPRFSRRSFGRSLRYKIWSEMLGLNVNKEEDMMKIRDPVHDDTWNYIKNVAHGNTSKFEMVFKDLVPSNRVRTADDLKGDGQSSGTIRVGNQNKYRRMSAAQMEPLLLEKNLNENVLVVSPVGSEGRGGSPTPGDSSEEKVVNTELSSLGRQESTNTGAILNISSLLHSGKQTSKRTITQGQKKVALLDEDVLENLKLANKGISMVGTTTINRADKSVTLLKSVKGYLVDWPLDFLVDDFNTMHPTALPPVVFQ